MAMTRMQEVKHDDASTHEELVKALLRRPAVRAELGHIRRAEGEWLDACGKQLVLKMA